MKALTVRQPWAWAIAKGMKLVENRTWYPSDDVIGARLAIHAGKAKPDVADITTVAKRCGMKGAQLILPRGAIVATVRVTGVARKRSEVPVAQRAWFSGPVGWLLDEVEELVEPVESKGQLGLWQVKVQLPVRGTPIA